MSDGLVLSITNGLVLLAAIRAWFQVQFYRGYFRQKQRNAGVDPDEILRSELGWFWWIIR